MKPEKKDEQIFSLIQDARSYYVENPFYPRLNNLLEMHFNRMPMSVQKMGLLIKMEQKQIYTNLWNVQLYNCKICPTILKEFVKIKLPALKYLSLGDNNLGDIGIKHMRNSKWPNLNKLELYRTGLTDISAPEIFYSHWPLLKELYLSYNNMSDATVFLTLPVIHQRKMKKVIFRIHQCTKSFKQPLHPRFGTRGIRGQRKLRRIVF